MSNQKKHLAVLASGSGTNLQAVIDAIKNNKLKDTEISIVISNKLNAYALERAKKEGINSIFINPSDFKTNLEFDKKIVEVLSNYCIDLIILAGYTKILSIELINTFSNKIINIHPALLPNFGGKGMYGQNVHKAVLESNTKETGCTVHYVTEEVDAGPIIAQRKVPVLSNDTIETLSNRVLQEEHKILPEAIELVLFNQKALQNTYNT